MTKKNINRVLIIVVVSIWGGLLYKIFNKKQVNVSINSYEQKTTENQEFIIKKDTFELVILEKDPFLEKKSPHILNNSTQNKVKIKKIISKELQQIKLPKLTYLGFVKGENSRNPLVLIRIDNKLYKNKLHTKIDEIYLDKIIKDSLVVQFNKKRIVLPKTK